MGWIGSGDTQAQVKLLFDTREEALAYAETNGIEVEVEIAARPRVQAEGLRGQLPLRPSRQLDALTG